MIMSCVFLIYQLGFFVFQGYNLNLKRHSQNPQTHRQPPKPFKVNSYLKSAYNTCQSEEYPTEPLPLKWRPSSIELLIAKDEHSSKTYIPN